MSRRQTTSSLYCAKERHRSASCRLPGAFESRIHVPIKTLRQVLQSGKWAKAVLRSTVRPSRDGELDAEVAARSDEEVAEGKVDRPFDEEEVDKLLGKCWAPCRRVGLRKGGVNKTHK